MDRKKLIGEMTDEEKAAIVAGTRYMHTVSVARLGIPELQFADGPHGLRISDDLAAFGVALSAPATAFPTSAMTANGWNPDLTRAIGEAIATECVNSGVNVLLAPGVNLKRNPKCGRNFEYYSEDPLLSGELAAAMTEGVQSKGVGVSVKHFALNNEEDYRYISDSVVDERAMRELYLKAFEIVIKKARPYSVMCAYNKINGVYCSENKWLLTELLRGEFGFDGLVMSDWGAVKDRTKGLESGMDLEMPGDTSYCRRKILEDLSSGALPREILDGAVDRVLQLIERTDTDREQQKTDFAAHHELSARAAEECAVLLRNDGCLPLNKSNKVFVTGELFEYMRYQGAGSSMICPTVTVSPKEAFDAMGVDYVYSAGYTGDGASESAYRAAMTAARDYETAVVFAGLTDMAETEACDRESMEIPSNQLMLINGLIDAGKKVIVVLFGGAPVEVPFADRVGAILYMCLPGQNGGTATARLLFGDANPCGKLSQTWVKEYADTPCAGEYSRNAVEVYRENIYVGYRYYMTRGVDVRYPFGFGLSYTEFCYEDLSVTERDGVVTVKLTVANVGARGGAEIVQLYVKNAPSPVFKAERELRAFGKVYVEQGGRRQLELTFNISDLSYYNVVTRRYELDSGEYEILIGASVNDIRLCALLTVRCGTDAACPYSENTNALYAAARIEDVTDEMFEEMSGLRIPKIAPSADYTLHTRVADFSRTFWGRRILGVMSYIINRQIKRAARQARGADRANILKGKLFMKKMMTTNTLFAISMSSGTLFPYNCACGVVDIANGRLLKGLKKFR